MHMKTTVPTRTVSGLEVTLRHSLRHQAGGVALLPCLSGWMDGCCMLTRDQMIGKRKENPLKIQKPPSHLKVRWDPERSGRPLSVNVVFCCTMANALRGKNRLGRTWALIRVVITAALKSGWKMTIATTRNCFFIASHQTDKLFMLALIYGWSYR